MIRELDGVELGDPVALSLEYENQQKVWQRIAWIEYLAMTASVGGGQRG
jgi:hypothetical protein